MSCFKASTMADILRRLHYRSGGGGNQMTTAIVWGIRRAMRTFRSVPVDPYPMLWSSRISVSPGSDVAIVSRGSACGSPGPLLENDDYVGDQSLLTCNTTLQQRHLGDLRGRTGPTIMHSVTRTVISVSWMWCMSPVPNQIQEPSGRSKIATLLQGVWNVVTHHVVGCKGSTDGAISRFIGANAVHS